MEEEKKKNPLPIVPYEEMEEEEEPSLMDLFAKWTSEKLKSGRKKRFAEVE